ncbi:hypothetical protein F2Q69_00055449 [Brassica cretica]|uniref:Uncharacterized protein n=1 Tax=Brassica cretica TaxID=69181 RepID=A0A8S9N3Z1_BRACR|nr:hypothetical protein F2Q69_00055449 [Brassica cretica]
MAIVSPSRWRSSTSTGVSLVDDGPRRFLSFVALLDEGNGDCSLGALLDETVIPLPRGGSR